jgi:4-hydroxyacetophenone monooxygenase
LSQWDCTLQQASDGQLRAALEYVHVPAIMAALVHLNGNTEHLATVKPYFDLMAEEEDGLTEAQRSLARELAFAALTKYRDSGCGALTAPDDAVVSRTMDYITGHPIAENLQPFLREELNLQGEDRRRVHIDTAGIDANFKVLIIGSGMSGILAAIRLQQAGIPFLMVDKNPEIGGTWFENTYPGCKVDSINHLYNYIFEPNDQWPGHYSGQADLKAYFNRVVDKYQLRAHIRCNTAVKHCDYQEEDGNWQVQVTTHGEAETLTFSAVIGATGQLNKPRLPDIEGLDSFAGTAFHSARWEYQHDLSGKRVIVIGTGCSAVQFVPEIAPQCAQVTVFQRTPPWLTPSPLYREAMTPEELWLFREVPFYARWYRFYLFRSRAVDGHLPLLYAEQDWQGQDGTVSEGNAQLRTALLDAMKEHVGDNAELLEQLTPDYPPGGKRPVCDDGTWIRTLQRDNVALVTERIEKVVPEGVITADGSLHPADVIIYGTGFQANRLLAPMQIRGRGGAELVSQWGGNPQAYLGTVMADFPNFYCLYGPNTNIVVGSSIVFFVECQMRYVSGCLKLQVENGYRSMECKPEVMQHYNETIDALNNQRAWGAPCVQSWYKNEQGRVTQNWPGTHWEFWQQTLKPQPDDYVLK